MKHARSGLLRDCPLGFSWTNLFFGCFVGLFRGWYAFFFAHLATALLTLGLSHLVFPFFVNRAYIKHLIDVGYIPSSAVDREVLVKRGFVFHGSGDGTMCPSTN